MLSDSAPLGSFDGLATLHGNNLLVGRGGLGSTAAGVGAQALVAEFAALATLHIGQWRESTPSMGDFLLLPGDFALANFASDTTMRGGGSPKQAAEDLTLAVALGHLPGLNLHQRRAVLPGPNCKRPDRTSAVRP